MNRGNQFMSNKEEFVAYCLKYKDSIYVRAEINGRWKSVALGELSPEKIDEHIIEWYNRQFVPIMFRGDMNNG